MPENAPQQQNPKEELASYMVVFLDPTSPPEKILKTLANYLTLVAVQGESLGFDYQKALLHQQVTLSALLSHPQAKSLQGMLQAQLKVIENGLNKVSPSISGQTSSGWSAGLGRKRSS